MLTSGLCCDPDSLVDGADLLSLSREFNVHIALAPKPLSLRVEGVIQSLRRVAERIKLLKSVWSPSFPPHIVLITSLRTNRL